VFVDGEFLAACPIDVATALQLTKGMEMSAELEHSLRSQDRRMVLKQKAYRFASYKPRTEHQVLVKLQKLEATPEECQEILGWLRSFHLVNDEEFVHRFLEAARDRKPLSPADATRRLRSKGIGKELAAELVVGSMDDESVIRAARQVAERRANALAGRGSDQVRERVQRFLAGRGYDWSVVRRVLTDMGLMLLVFVLQGLGLMAQLVPMQSAVDAPPDSARTVALSLDILDAASGEPLFEAKVQMTSMDSSIGAATVAPLMLPVQFGTARGVLLEHERVELLTTARGYLPHRQVISVHNLDSSVDLRLNARMYAVGKPMLEVMFGRGTADLDTNNQHAVYRVMQQMVAQNMHVEIRGATVDESLDSASAALVRRRVDTIEKNMIALGCPPTLLHARYLSIPYSPALLTLKEDPLSQRVQLIPIEPPNGLR
jgi:regulatory protein